MRKYIPFLVAGAATIALAGCFGAKDTPTQEPTTDTADTLVSVGSGNYVQVQYVGRLAGGEDAGYNAILADCAAYEVFDTSHEELAKVCDVYVPQRNYAQPLEFQVGEGKIIAGFDESVRGRKVGDTYTIQIDSADAYGERLEDNIVEISKDQLLQSGMSTGDLQNIQAGDDFPTPIGAVKVVEVTEDALKLDANHPLAGKDLIFDIEIVGITEEATQSLFPSVDMPTEDMDEEVAEDMSEEANEVMEEETSSQDLDNMNNN